jgi:hypothetical protein
MNGNDDRDVGGTSGGPPRPPGMMALAALPLITGIGALVIGGVLGLAVGWVVKPAEKVEVEVPRELTPEELTAACATEVQESTNQLEEAQGKVAFLEKEVEDRQARVVELETEMARRAERGKDLVAELEKVKRDLAEAVAALEVARAEKERLVIELTQTQEELAETEAALTTQKKATSRAQEDALVNKWYRFINDAQLEICEKGNRKKLGNCRETVQATLMTNPRRDKFAHCVRSGQATPMVRELSKGEGLPDFSEMIDEEQKQTKGWYLLLCDPTLPEKTDGFLNEAPLPPTEPVPEGEPAP